MNRTYQYYLDSIEAKVDELKLYVEKLKTENELLKVELDRSNTALEIARKAIDKQNPEWISVEDERKPDDGETCIVMTSTDCIYNFKYSKDGFPIQRRIRYWMHKPALPKPKEPSFKDVFLKAFPKATMYNDGIPLSCRVSIFGGKCSLGSTKCFECWNQPYFEPEEEGERNVATSK